MSQEPIDSDQQPSQAEEFKRQADRPPPGVLAEFLDFLLHNKKWWLAPIIIVLLLLGVLVVVGGSGVLPFIYPF
jgi:hypothetical protein